MMVDELLPKGKVAVRMFCHGLGDCFLIAIAGKTRPQYVVVDCGIIGGNPDGPGRTREIVEALRQSCKGCVDRLIITHEHWDHISGFVDAAVEWDLFKRIDELWFAWTESPSDETAIAIRASRKQAMEIALKAFGRCPASAQEQIARVFGFMGYELTDLVAGKALQAAGKVSKTRKAMEAAESLVRGKGGKIRYWEPGDVHPLESGVQFVVLGPPKDLVKLKDSDPSKKNPEVYTLLRASASIQGFANALDPEARTSTFPFDACCRIPKEQFLGGENPALKPFAELRDQYLKKGNEWRRIDDDWLVNTQFLAMDLDDDTNNTSLTFALYDPEEDASMIFAADAQVGNWLSWGDRDYVLTLADNSKKTFTIDDLLSRAAFYKVGHHGSHNATLSKRGLELMTSHRLSAMIPVDVSVAHDKKKWTKMPFQRLLRRLEELTCRRAVPLDAKQVSEPFAAGPESDVLGRQLYIDLNPVV